MITFFKFRMWGGWSGGSRSEQCTTTTTFSGINDTAECRRASATNPGNSGGI